MMPSIEIRVIDHRARDLQPLGPIIKPLMVEEDDAPGSRYADFCGLYYIWQACQDRHPDIIGFFGYRKYLMPEVDEYPEWTSPAHAVGWRQCNREAFEDYRAWWAGSRGVEIKELLAQYDIIQAPPFQLTRGIYHDFLDSRSREDAASLRGALPDHWTSKQIFPYLFITRWSVFDRMMHELEPYRLRLEPLCTGADSTEPEYKKRPMAYVMERVYSLWLENSGLSIKEVPLLHCWEMS